MDLKEDLIPSQISQYGPRTGGSFDSEKRPTEDTVVKMVSDRYIMQLELSVSAIGAVLETLPHIDREIIRLKYWSGEFTSEGIAYKLHIDKATMYRHLNVILTEIGKRLGYVDI